jgi:hypothetical protein
MRALALAVALAGCGGNLTAEGEHHRYVISKLEFPMTDAEVMTYSRDVDGDSSVDNLFARPAIALATHGILIESGNTLALANATLLMLADLQARDLTTAAAAGFEMFLGENPTPTPCVSETSCGHHLLGTGEFDTRFELDHAPALVGTIRDGAFSSVSGELNIEISATQERIIREGVQIPLIAARVELTSIADDAIDGVITGAVERDKAIAIGSDLSDDIRHADFDCDVSATPPECGCTTELGTILMREFDLDRNCLLLSEEVTAVVEAFAPLATADVSIDGVAAASFGVGFHAVPATFTPD